MRTPTWESSPGALAAFFTTAAPLIKADCWTITLASGTVLRWSGADVPISFGGNTFALGPGITRGLIKWRLGISTDKLDVTLTDVAGTILAGKSLIAFAKARGFTDARVQLERVFWGLGDTAPRGALLWFLGDVDDAEGDRREVKLSVSSFTRRLEVAVPRGVYQTQCLNTLGDARCGVALATYTAAGTATTATDSYRTSFGHALAQPAGWGSLGLLTMTSGANAGISRTCKLHAAGTLTALQPWPAAVAAGDTFTLRAGCDRMMATCSAKFANLARFRGTPFVPAPETAT